MIGNSQNQNTNFDNPLLNHKSDTCCNNPELMEFGFLIKYCSSSSYRRLYQLLEHHIPTPSTIDSHFKKDVSVRKHYISNASEITPLLDNYWDDVKVKVSIIFKTINQHKRFHARFLAADGARSLDKLHKVSFQKYSKYIQKVKDGKISIDDLIETVEKECVFLPILDILHSAKRGRNNIINNDIKLGEESNIVNKKGLSEYLEILLDILKDTTSIGRINDEYPINLFIFENAKVGFYKNQITSCFYIIVYSSILEITFTIV